MSIFFEFWAVKYGLKSLKNVLFSLSPNSFNFQKIFQKIFFFNFSTKKNDQKRTFIYKYAILSKNNLVKNDFSKNFKIKISKKFSKIFDNFFPKKICFLSTRLLNHPIQLYGQKTKIFSNFLERFQILTF